MQVRRETFLLWGFASSSHRFVNEREHYGIQEAAMIGTTDSERAGERVTSRKVLQWLVNQTVTQIPMNVPLGFT